MIALDFTTTSISSKRLACLIEEEEEEENHLQHIRPTKRVKQQPKRRGVTFDEASNEVHHRSYDETDLKNCWISDEEYQSIRSDTKQTILEIKKVRGKMSLLNVKLFCIRGLERLIASLMSRSDRASQKEAVRSVLTEQQAQKKVGTKDPFAMSSIYSNLSTAAQKKARHLANIDARAR
mmetsp:Transcript_16082/g.35338  ORF Transcript_16082/g.35338 Transcript_16082/m.35338 type:complete len:179 (+) Transcript_16082:165-701(+)